MKAKLIRVEKLKNLGNYEHEKISIDIEIEENDNINEVLKKARAWLNQKLNEGKNEFCSREYYLRVVNNSDEYRYSEVERAKKWLKENPEDDDMYEEEPPF